MAMILIGQNSRHVVNHALALVKIRWNGMEDANGKNLSLDFV